MKLNETKSRWYTIVLGGFLCLGLLSAGYAASKVSAMKEVTSPPRSGGVGSVLVQDRTGSPIAIGTCTSCHGGGGYNPSLSVTVRDIGNNVVTTYTPGDQYTVEYSITGSGSPTGFGMQAVILDAANNGAGAYGTINTPNSQISVVGGRDYFEQQGIQAAGFFSVDWTAPASGTGTVTIYGMGIALNGNGGTSGDNATPAISLSLTEDVPTVIDFPGNPYCSNVANPTPVVTGEQGGTFSAPIGLDINASTGIINMTGSTPGTYTVTYTGATETATFDVTINPTVTSTDSATICVNETFVFGGQTLTSANAGLNTEVFQAVNGCDSTVELTLTVLPTPTEQLAETICANETFNFNGQILDASNAGLNTYMTTSVGGCDSTVELTLTVLSLDIVQISETICAHDTYDFNGQILDSSDVGLNTITLSNMNGCDSTVELTLDVATLDQTLTISPFMLTSNQPNATYQWINCSDNNSILPGETDQSLNVWTADAFAVIITLGNCTDTSTCEFAELQNVLELEQHLIQVYPSPAQDILTIHNLAALTDVKSLIILNALGEIVNEISVVSEEISVSELPSGTYFLKVPHAQGLEVVKFVKR